MIANQLSDHSALRQIGTDDAVENRNVTLIFNAKSLSVHSSLPKPPFSLDVFWLTQSETVFADDERMLPRG
jgi:hypothetical protein